MSIEVEEVKKFIEKADHKSLIDVGCGDGRWYPYLKEWGVDDYVGIDISENLIKAAQFRFPHIKERFSTLKVEELSEIFTNEKFDLIFSYTTLEHIKAEDWPKAVAALKKVGKKLLLIEPTGFVSRYYCHDHPYDKDFKVVDRLKLKDKVIYLCDLQS